MLNCLSIHRQRFYISFTLYTGCHKYVPFAGVPNGRTLRVQRIELITNMTTAILERLDQAILEVIDNPEKTQQTAAIGTLF